jgi:hypothetical protein
LLRDKKKLSGGFRKRAVRHEIIELTIKERTLQLKDEMRRRRLRWGEQAFKEEKFRSGSQAFMDKIGINAAVKGRSLRSE